MKNKNETRGRKPKNYYWMELKEVRKFENCKTAGILSKVFYFKKRENCKYVFYAWREGQDVFLKRIK